MTAKREKVKKISPTRLRNVALWYLDRFGGTRSRVRQTLQRRVHEAEPVHGPVPEAGEWIEAVLNELEELGHINDAAFADSRVRKGLRQGRSQRMIAQDLAKAGVTSHIARAAIAANVETGDAADFEAAAKYVRSRRLGPFREDAAAHEQRDMAKLARRGFSYEIARRALSLDVEELD